jgi:hypothetical protein
MRKFLVFIGDIYEAGGGWADFKGQFDGLKEAAKLAATHDDQSQWFQIIDSETGNGAPKITSDGWMGESYFWGCPKKLKEYLEDK